MTTRILIVRTSSLGDLVHMLPAISDIAKNVANAKIDWLVEESFAEIPAWHPAINEVITVAHRRWRKNWWAKEIRKQRQALKQELGRRQYDVVLDMQALMKSVWLVRQTNGKRHGLDWKSAREPLASLFYDVRHRIEFWQAAVIRQRSLAAAAFNYEVEGPADFGLQEITNSVAVERAALIMPSASRDDKLWPDDYWQHVFDDLEQRGLQLRLLSGNDVEFKRAQQMISGRLNAMVLPRMSLTQVAHELAKAEIMIGLDSGLTHLSAGLERPTIGIYKASTPVRTPLQGTAYTASLGDRGNQPDAIMVQAAVKQALD